MPKFNELVEDALDDDNFGGIPFHQRDPLVRDSFPLSDFQFVERFAFLIQKQSLRTVGWRSAAPIPLLCDLRGAPNRALDPFGPPVSPDILKLASQFLEGFPLRPPSKSATLLHLNRTTMSKNQLKRFRSLPVNSRDVWQGGLIPLAQAFPEFPGELKKHGVVGLWVSSVHDAAQAAPVTLIGRSPLDALVESLCDFPKEFKLSARPGVILCPDESLAAGLGELLQDSGTEVRYDAEPERWMALRDNLLAEASQRPSEPSLSDAGSTDQQIREFAATAAEFYQAKPWLQLESCDVMVVESPESPPSMQATCVMGAAQETFGLGFYEDLESSEAFEQGNADPDQMNVGSLVYSEPEDAGEGDLKLWGKLDLPLASESAFPDMNFFFKSQMRRPKPAELDYATLIMKALLETREEELDQGRWSKSITVGGVTQQCVLTIPSVCSPPEGPTGPAAGLIGGIGQDTLSRLVDRIAQEKGESMSVDELKTAVQAHIAGKSLDELHPDDDTPRGRALALCQQAEQIHGRRRIVLAKEAVALDPSCVEAHLARAEATICDEARCELFRAAQKLAREQLGADFEELKGQFWGHWETRPYMRASYGLAQSLIDLGRETEGINEFRQMLRLNPSDNQGVRYDLISLLLEFERDDEAFKLLKSYDETSARWLYARALLEFRRSGPSPAATKAIEAAFAENRHVVRQLQAAEPPEFPGFFSPHSPDEAALVIDEQYPAWDLSDDFLDWMLQAFYPWEKAQARKKRARGGRPPRGSKNKGARKR